MITISQSALRRRVLATALALTIFGALLVDRCSAAIILPTNGGSGTLQIGGRAGGQQGDRYSDFRNVGPLLTFNESLRDMAALAGATASSDASLNVNIVRDSNADTLSVSSGSTILLSASQGGMATGVSNFQMNFELIGRSYNYTLTGNSSASASQLDARNRGSGGFQFSGPNSPFLFYNFFVAEGRPQDGREVIGSPTGLLGPGVYSIRGNAGGTITLDAGGAITQGQGNFAFNFQLRLTPIDGDIIRSTNPAGGAFSTTANWDQQRVPEKTATRSDVMLFDLDQNYTISVDGPRTAERLVVRAGRVQFSGDTLTLAATSDTQPSVAVEGTGRLNIVNGHLRSVYATIGAAPPQSPQNVAQVLVSNAGTDWITSANLAVGKLSKGILFVANGGKVTSAAATIGGIFDGEAIVGGQGSHWTTGNLAVGGAGGAGTLTVEAGAKVESATARIGHVGGSPGTVLVQGAHVQGANVQSSILHATLDLIVAGGGMLEVRDGGSAFANRLLAVGERNTRGMLTISGVAPGVAPGTTTQSFANVNEAWIGTNGPGSVLIENGGAFIGVGPVVIGRFADGEIVVRGSHQQSGKRSELFIGSQLVVGDGAPGTLRLEDGLVTHGGNPIRVAPPGKIVGTGTLDGTGTITNDGDIDIGLSPGKLTITGDYVQTATGQLKMEIGGPTPGTQHDQLEIMGNATLGGLVNLIFTDGFAPRTGDQFALMPVGGSLTDAGLEVNIVNLAPDFQFDLRRDGGRLTMVALNDGVYIQPLPPSTWNVDADGNWSTAANWTAGVPNVAGASAIFGNKITAPRTVTADIPITVGRIDFDSANPYTIAGSNTISVNATSGFGQINVTTGSHTISAPLSLADNTVINIAPADGNLSITAPMSASDIKLTKAGLGSLTLANVRTSALSVHSGTVAIAPNGTPAGTSAVGTLLIAGNTDAWTTKLDLANNDAVVQSTAANKATDFARLHNQVKQGFNNGAWTGQGITSSSAAGNANSDTGLSVVDNALLGVTSFSGQPVTADSILLKYTYYGDIDANGQVDADDLTVFASNFGRASGATQVDGDIDFNGAVDADDLTVVANNFAKGLATPLAANNLQAVPEPQTHALMAIGMAALLVAARTSKCRFKSQICN
jgi:T5SS/PEP-CTERM-associated repeat protein